MLSTFNNEIEFVMKRTFTKMNLPIVQEVDIHYELEVKP